MKKVYVALKRTAEDERVTGTKGWKSYTCFSADYLQIYANNLQISAVI